jgi:hypothetical protein
MAGLPNKKSGRDPKFKEAFAIRLWQPLSSQHLLPFIGTSEDVHVEVGVGVSSLCETPPSSGPSEPRVGLVRFVGNRERNAVIMPRHSCIEPKRCMGLFWELSPGPLAPDARIAPLDQAAKRPQRGEPTNTEHGVVAATYSHGKHAL